MPRAFSKISSRKFSNKTFTLSLASALLAISVSPLAQAKFYHWVDDEGTSHYSQNPPPAKYADQENKKTKRKTIDSNVMREKEAYLEKRKRLRTKMSQTTQKRKRQLLAQEINTLDINWFEKHDPEKARQLKKQLGDNYGAAKVRVIKKSPKKDADMKKLKAFY